MEYNLQHFQAALNLINRNIESGVAIENDYILKAMILRCLYNSPEKNQEAMNNILFAKTLNVLPNNYVYKQEGITFIRLGKMSDANLSFQTYLNSLEDTREKSDYINKEIEWTKKMMFKSKVL